MSEEHTSYGIYSPAVLGILIFAIIVCFFLYILLNVPIVRTIITLMVIALAITIGLLFFKSSTPLRVKRSKLLVEFAEPKENSLMLDVGTGRGLVAISLAKACKNCKVIGIDTWSPTTLSGVSGNTMENAIKNAKVEKVSKRVKFQEADARKLPFANNTFDLVACHEVLDTLIVGRDEVLSEIYRVLKKGGKFVFSTAVAKYYLVWKLSKLGFKKFQFLKLGLREGPAAFVLCRK
ncbi:MAG: class I SAM-dependent methyltransferase [Candidatus Jordarchaeum sp.]|uniref:class I SAM-dependent methyltransferase n=1 Tax=Candidatus Jordarchaeum sp. TaxID=2823881 RepID=UPI004049E8C6